MTNPNGVRLLALADAGERHAEGLSAQLERPDWRPSRAHIEQARNSIAKLAAALRAAPVPQRDGEPGDDCSCGGGNISGHDAMCPYARPAAPPSRLDAGSVEAMLATIDAIISDNVYVDNDGVAGISSAAEAVLAALTPPALPAGEEVREIEFEYTNWEGRQSLRRARPISIRFGKSKWHPQPGWLMLAFDLDKGAEREFEMREMVFEDLALASIALSPSSNGKPR